MARSKYFEMTARDRLRIEGTVEQIIRDRVLVDLSSDLCAQYGRIHRTGRPVKDFPVGMMMEEMMRIIREMETMFEAATGKNYSTDAALSLIRAGVLKRTETWGNKERIEKEVQDECAWFLKKCEEDNKKDVRDLYSDAKERA